MDHFVLPIDDICLACGKALLKGTQVQVSFNLHKPLCGITCRLPDYRPRAVSLESYLNDRLRDAARHTRRLPASGKLTKAQSLWVKLAKDAEKLLNRLSEAQVV